MEILLLSLAAGSGLCFTIFKTTAALGISIKKVLHYDWMFDIAITLVLPCLLTQSTTGMMIAIFTGIVLSIELLILKKLIGSEPLGS